MRVGRAGVVLSMTSLGLDGCEEDEENDIEVVAKSEQTKFVNANPMVTRGEASKVILPNAVDSTTVRYASLVGGRQQDTVVFVDDPSAAWLEGEHIDLPSATRPSLRRFLRFRTTPNDLGLSGRREPSLWAGAARPRCHEGLL